MRIAIAGAGLAGLAAAWVLAEQGFVVDLYESRAFPGGRAASYQMPDGASTIQLDNSQHILMRCCHNLIDFLHRLGVQHLVEYHSAFTFLEPGGRASRMAAGRLPAPLHFAESFAALRFLSLPDKLAVARGMLAVQRAFPRGPLLDSITMEQWLRTHGQSETALRRFWEPVLVSAVNETLPVISAWQGIRVIYLGFLAGKRNYEMGVPTVPLAQLFAPERFQGRPNLRLHFHQPITGFATQDGAVAAMLVNEQPVRADAYISALPYQRLHALFPLLDTGMRAVQHSPIAGIHLRFAVPVTTLPHAALLDRTMQWFFAHEGGRLLSLVVSASRALAGMRQQEIVDLALRELAEFLPSVASAPLTGAWVVRETTATFVASPGMEQRRPGPITAFPNFFLAGEFTNTGWPSTMEGAVYSGYRAAEAVCARLGKPVRVAIASAGGKSGKTAEPVHRI